MSEEESKPFKRWHDNRGDLSTAVELLESIPPEVIPYIAEGLFDVAERDFDASAILSGLKSMGRDRILSLHQSRKKRRSYDQDPNLHRIVNIFFVLPEEAQETVAAQFVDFTALMVDYMATCDAFGAEPKREDLEQMRKHYVDHGTEAVKTYLQTVHENYNQLIQAEEAALQKPPGMVTDANGGLRLRKGLD